MNRLATGGFLLVTIGLLAGSPTAVYGEPAKFDVREFVCPLGGKHFTQDVGYFTLAFVQFADGSWLGDTKIDVQIPVCPGNGLLLIPDFDPESPSDSLTYLTYTPEQLARIPMLLKSKEFGKLKSKGRYERAQWLATQLGLPAKTRWELLIRSSWAAAAPDERKRLVLRIIEEGPRLISEFDGPELQKLSARWRVVNALREAARFDEARAELSSIAESLSHAGENDDAQSGETFDGDLARMSEAIEARDDDRFPIGMSPSKWAAGVCRGEQMPPPYGPMTNNAKAACAKRRQESVDRESAYQEESRLRKDPVQLAHLCDTTPESQRSRGLNDACESAQRERDSRAAEDLVLHQPGKVAADCEATSENRRTGPLFYACVNYKTHLGSALTELLADDEAAYDLICGDGNSERPDLASFASLACFSAEREREDREVRKLLADTKTLDEYCARTPTQFQEQPYGSACFKRRLLLIQAEKERLAADPAAYAAECSNSDASDAEKKFRCSEASRIREQKEEASKRNALVAQCRAQKPGSVAASPGVDCAALLADEQRRTQVPDSELHEVAMENARRVVAKAKADKTYPKRKRGDLY